jgi:hypothetical protein
MECDDPRFFQEWVIRWQDLVDFEIVPVVPSKQTAERIITFLHAETDNQHPHG